jgi:2-amino-4-hydroxy-6-hydroxymethyldihydropteridine diphosphokinase
LPELAFIALGSNLSPEMNLPLAAGRLAELGRVRGVSMVYQNPAIGPSPAPDFLNAAVLVETELSATEIRDRLRRIEAELGRVRTADKYAPRVIDLDLCLLGSQVLETPELRLPDPDVLTRPHLAIPLAELDPDFPHPVTGEPLGAIAARLRPHADLRPRPDVACLFPSIHPRNG